MVALKNIQTKFSLPREFDEEQRAIAARLIIDAIQANTSMGKNRYGGTFHSYSPEYKKSLEFKNAGKSSLPNLQLTGDMLASLELVSSKPGEITIGYKAGDSLAGQVEGNQIGSYGGTPSAALARPFIGLPQSQLDLIIANVIYQTKQDVQVQSKVDSLVQNLLSRFF